jgi:hypothetical protein
MSNYAYLGPAGTFTQAALQKITSSSDQLIPYANVTATLNAVRIGEAEFALVPIENSIEGVVARTLDELATGDPLVIAGEVTLPVTFVSSIASRPIHMVNHSAAPLSPLIIQMQRSLLRRPLLPQPKHSPVGSSMPQSRLMRLLCTMG